MSVSNGFPIAPTSGSGLFNGPSSTGMIQGQADPDPATRNALQSGVVSTAETQLMYGGIGIYAYVSPVSSTGPKQQLGPVIGRATGLTGSYPLVGFSVFDQAYNAVNDPINTVPSVGSSQTFNFYALGSRARIAVACDPGLVSLRGGTINPQVSWDFVNQLLVPYLGTLTISSGTYNNTTGLVTLTMSAAVTFDAGDAIVVSGLSGTGAYASLAGTFTSLSATGTTVTYNAGAALGASTITAGSLTLGSGASSALPVTILEVQPTGCMTVVNSSGTLTYNYSGACAKIQLTGGTTA